MNRRRKVIAAQPPKRKHYPGNERVWTIREASEWSGIPLRILYGYLRQGVVPHLPLLERKPQEGKRQRRTFRWLVPAVAFQKWLETLSSEKKGAA